MASGEAQVYENTAKTLSELATRRDGDAADAGSGADFSSEAVATMRRAVAAGGGRMAQFAHPEFGGIGQWMQGGMVMTSAGRDVVLERRIDRLCEALGREGDAGLADDAGVTAPDAARLPESVRQTDSTHAAEALLAIEKLAELHARGIVTADEFAAKKAELLARI